MITAIIIVVIALVFLLGYLPLFFATLNTNRCIWPMNIIVGKKFRAALLKNWNSKDWLLTEVSYSTARRVQKDVWKIYAEASHHSGRWTNHFFIFEPEKDKIHGDFTGEKLLKGGD